MHQLLIKVHRKISSSVKPPDEFMIECNDILANPAGSTITSYKQAGVNGVIAATESIADGAGNTPATSSFASQNTLSTVNETLSTTTLNVKHITGGAGADTLTGDANGNWLAGGLGADQLYGGGGDDVLCCRRPKFDQLNPQVPIQN